MTASVLGADQPAAVRKPQLQIAFGSAAPGGLSADIAVLGTGDDPWQRSVMSIETACALAPQVDVTKLVIANDQQAPAVVLDNLGSIALGYEDSTTNKVITGYIHRLQFNTRNTTTISVTNGGARLSQLRINQSYEQQAAGDLVSDLCAQANVATDTIESGIDLPFYVIDDRHHAYQHIQRLARLCGYVAYFTVAGELYFGPTQTGSAVQTFSYSNDILELRVQQNNVAATAVTVVGEGAAGAEGQEAWSWLIKDPDAITAEAGDGKARLIRNAALRNLEASQAMANGVADSTAAMNLGGQILTPGAPAVVVGSTIEITDAPADDMNGEFYVTQVSHRYDKREGFTSLIRFKQASAGGFSLGGLL